MVRLAAALTLVALLGAAASSIAQGTYSIVPIAFEGEPIMAAGQIANYNQLSGPPVMNSDGDIALRVRICCLPVFANPEGIALLPRSGSARMIAYEGQATTLPGAPHYSVFRGISMNDSQQIAFIAGYGDPANGDQAVFRLSAGSITPIVALGDPLPHPIGGTVNFISDGVGINSLGHVAFNTRVSNRSGTLLWSDNTLIPLAIPGELAPDSNGASYTTTGGVDFTGLNSRDEAGVFSQLTGNPSNRGLYLTRSGNDSFLSIRGEAVPGTGGQVVVNYGGGVSVNDNGDAAFRALIGTCSTPEDCVSGVDGVLLRSGNITTTIALTGDPVPGTTGSTFKDVGASTVGPHGEVSFTGQYMIGPIQKGGLFIYREGQTVPAVLDGDPVSFGSEIRVFSAGNMNARGDIAFTGELSSGLDGVFLATQNPPDEDGDGTWDGRDNCPNDYNVDQADTDSNGVGNACNEVEDTDSDEWADALDNCATAANPDQADRDRDRFGDTCDLCPDYHTSSNNDFDQNGIGDLCECGDQTGDAVVNVLDLLGINLAIFGAVQKSPLCDTNNDGLCNVQDIVGANQKIFGAPAYCSRYPPPGP